MKNPVINNKIDFTKTRSTCPYATKSHVPLDFYDESFIANPELTFQKLRNIAPIQQITLGDEFPIWLISKYDDVTNMLRDPRFVKSLNNSQTLNNESSKEKAKRTTAAYILRRWHMLSSDPPQHTRLRGFTQKAFTPKIVAEMRPRIQQITDELIDKIYDNKKMDFLDDFAYPLPFTVIIELLGIPIEDQEKLRRWSDVLIESHITDKNKQSLNESSEAFIDYMKNILDLRRKKPGNDLISAFLKLEEAEDHMTEDELYASILLLIIAGHETTLNLISNGMHALLSHPDQLELLKNNPKLIHSAIEEMLRYNSPLFASTMRLAAEDITIKGITIKKGEGALALFSSANQDEAMFNDSLRFDITRENNKHLAFGHGIHFCMGAALARLECEIAINTILNRLPNLRFDKEAKVLKWRPSNIIRGLHKFPVVF
ncbi:cytochrome P450 [Flavobacterium sp. AJR]|uniref:cytochrome P450 family protein n=1 Tax=Flavobacterium sp. AJR TaxID=1979369 RepID=UPI000A3D6854|nr:cytochrome P450 [Flavobacterium sp. AJR]OUL60975.1 hypothetical protein B8T70_17665 [Flavobacterium sp. AJR]